MVIEGFLQEKESEGEIREEANIKVRQDYRQRAESNVTVWWKKRPTCQKNSSQPQHRASLDTWAFVSSCTPASAHVHTHRQTPTELNVQADIRRLCHAGDVEDEVEVVIGWEDQG